MYWGPLSSPPVDDDYLVINDMERSGRCTFRGFEPDDEYDFDEKEPAPRGNENAGQMNRRSKRLMPILA